MKKIALSILSAILLMPFLSTAQENDLFKVKTPNVMIIFDTSASMEMSINVDKYGNSIWTTKKGPDLVTEFVRDGNHPDSRLYQAKDALRTVINDVVKDKVNLGFSTYAQTKKPQWRGRYQRDEEVIDQYEQTEAWIRYKRYYRWGTKNDSTTGRKSIYKDSFVDDWGYTRAVNPDDPTATPEWSRAIWIHDKSGPLHPQTCGSGAQCISVGYGYYMASKSYTVTYKVTGRTFDAEKSIYTYSYAPTSSDYDWYGEYTWNDGWSTASKDCGSDKKGSPWPDKQWSGGWWYTHFSDDSPPDEYNNPSNGRTANWWNCSWQKRDAKSKTSHTETKYKWDNSTGTSCDATKAGTPVWDFIPGTCFDVSYFKFEPWTDITGSYPFTWSYYKVKSPGGTWKKSDQNDPYYPAPAGDVGENDNRAYFVNFPDDKAGGFKDSDRTAIKNKIIEYLDLTPVKAPASSLPSGYNGYWTKLPIQALAGKKGLSANADGIGGNAVAAIVTKQTPLADSLAWANTYFEHYIDKYSGGDPASKETLAGGLQCRGNYIILLTDGLESCRYDSKGNPDYNEAAKEAKKLYDDRKVITFVIGFGADVVGIDNKAVLNKVALAGSGDKHSAYFTTTFAELKDALRKIFQVISGQYYGRSNPVITRKRDRLYRGNFDIMDEAYMGHLMAWDADLATGALAPEFVWDAGEKITINGRGPVYTWTDDGLNPARKDFTSGNATLYPFVSSGDINNDGPTNDLDAIGVIKFTLDPNYNDCADGVVDKDTLTCHGAGYYKGKRGTNVDIKGTTYPSWNLGDIYHSTPVVIAEPAFFFTEHNYSTFLASYLNREVLIYVGTNDGMLHVFKNTDGNEKFAIVPKCLLGKLGTLKASAHNFYVDSSPKAYDVYFKAESKWKTVLISGLRGGGSYYFALDITDPGNPKPIWEWPNPVNDPLNPTPAAAKLGNTWGKPDIGRVKVGAETKFVAFLTGGYTDPSKPENDNLGNSFHIIDIETGTALKSFDIGDMTNRVPSGPTAYDSDTDGFVNAIYFGDIKGTLWKVDVSSTDTDQWKRYEFWKDEPGKRRPIYYAPAVVKNDGGEVLIFFGTGDENNITDPDTFYAFYEIKDEGTTGKQTWTKNLGPGEKVLGSPAVANWVVYFTTWTSVEGSVCSSGEGRLYGLKISKVGAPGSSEGLVTLDGSGKWTDPQNYISLGAGIPSAPLVTNGMIYIGTSLNANKVIQIPIPGWSVARTKSWREVIQ